MTAAGWGHTFQSMSLLPIKLDPGIPYLLPWCKVGVNGFTSSLVVAKNKAGPVSWSLMVTGYARHDGSAIYLGFVDGQQIVGIFDASDDAKDAVIRVAMDSLVATMNSVGIDLQEYQ